MHLCNVSSIVSDTSIKIIWTVLSNPNKLKPEEEFVYGLEATLWLEISSKSLYWSYLWIIFDNPTFI